MSEKWTRGGPPGAQRRPGDRSAPLRPRPRGPLAVATALLIGLLPSFGCGDEGPSGPGTLAVEIEATGSAPRLGAVLVNVVGLEITGFSADPSVRLFHPEVSDSVPEHRVLAVLSNPSGSFSFSIETLDVGKLPEVVLLEGADWQNALITAPTLQDYSVRVSR